MPKAVECLFYHAWHFFCRACTDGCFCWENAGFQYNHETSPIASEFLDSVLSGIALLKWESGYVRLVETTMHGIFFCRACTDGCFCWENAGFQYNHETSPIASEFLDSVLSGIALLKWESGYVRLVETDTHNLGFGQETCMSQSLSC